MPLLMRFSDILHSRVQALFGCFDSAIREYGYQGRYRGVYPIKVNQQHQVVEELVRFGAPFGLGLEAGSKPELLAGLALLDSPDALLVCNGYKDDEYIETALLVAEARALPDHRGRPLPRARPAAAGRRAGSASGPHIGVRAKLTTKGAGKWMESTGDRSKFGLTATEIVMRSTSCATRRCSTASSCCTSTSARRSPRSAPSRTRMREASRIYVELVKAGRRAQVPRRRRRPGRRLRRLADQLPLVHELHHAGVRQRRRRPRSWRPATTREGRRTPTSSPSRAARWSRTTRCWSSTSST